MSGQVTIGGKTEGLTGQVGIGPITVTGNAVIAQVSTLELKAGDTEVLVPKGAVLVVMEFAAIYEGPEVKLRTNLNLLEAGLPMTGQGFAVLPLTAATTSLVLHSAGSTTVGVTFI